MASAPLWSEEKARMIPQRKRPVEPKPELDFDTTQEIDPALVDSILTRGSEATLVPGDFDETAIMLDLPGGPAKPANRRR
jgi:hypothetical protein